MKFKKFFTAIALSSLLVAGALFVGESAKAQEVKATTDLGTFTFDEANADSTPTGMYGINWTVNDAPAGWDTEAFSPVDAESGTFVDGVRVGAEIKKVTAYAYYIAVPGGTIGTVATVKGTWANSTYSFTVNEFTRQCVANPGKWVYALEDYDVVSLADANMPNFENVVINTDDIDSSYNYVTDPAGLPKQKGYFGLTNSTGSYAFQFNYQKSSTGTGWFHVLIGGRGPLWNSGHFIDFGFLDAWKDTGDALIKEMSGIGDNWSANEIQATDAIPLGWNVGAVNLLEMGLIKVKGMDLHYIFFKVNGTIKWSDYWELEDGAMTTKVTLQYAGTDAKVTNSLEPSSSRLSFGSYNSEAKQIYLNVPSDICPAVNNWSDYFMSTSGEGIKYNDVAVESGHWNFFKKTGTNQFFLALGDLGLTPVSGDILSIGGMFKAARDIGGSKTLFKANFADSYFQYNGETWLAINPNYEAADFAVDLLEMTLPVCSVSGNNHDALESIWEVLADADHFGALAIDEKDIIENAVADYTIVVPDNDADIEDMLPADAIAAAMARYDYCTGKYSLSNFISGRSVSLSLPTSANNYEQNSVDYLIIITAVIASISVLSVIILKKKKQK